MGKRLAHTGSGDTGKLLAFVRHIGSAGIVLVPY